MKKAVCKILYCFIALYIVFHFLPGHTCLAYQDGAHIWIASQALILSYNPDLQNQAYVDEIIKGSGEADYKFYDSVLGLWRNDDYTAPRDHFWNPDNGDALFPTFFTAYQKASEYWYLAIAAYKESPIAVAQAAGISERRIVWQR